MANVHNDYHILIVDDDVVDQRHYRQLLMRQCPGVCRIQQAPDGATGLALLREEQFDCVLLDFNLPDMTGLEFLTKATIADELPCAVVVVTGQGSEKIAVEAMKCGVEDYLVKDQMDTGRLWHAVNRAVTQTGLRRRLACSQRDLLHREALLLSILDTVPDALVMIDREGAIQSFSAAAERLFGFCAGSVKGTYIGALIPSTHWTTVPGRIQNVTDNNSIVFGLREDGSKFPIEVAIGEVNLPGEKLFTVFVHDITERQDRERRLSDTQAELVHVSRLTELGQMVFALAHEVTQPLTAMASYLGGARRLLAAGNQHDTQQAFNRILEQLERAQQIIQRLRDHARKRDMEKRSESLLRTIEEASMLAGVGLDQRLKLTICVEDDATEVVIDKIQIQQVLLNLIRNAAEAMRDSARCELSITANRNADMVEINVADTGPGLEDSVRARLFQPFVTTKRDGMGVGLSVCRTIVEMHGGELRAEDGVGGGTVFRLTIPRTGASSSQTVNSLIDGINTSQYRARSQELVGRPQDSATLSGRG